MKTPESGLKEPLSPGDHCCLIYQTDSELKEALRAYLDPVRSRKEQCIWIGVADADSGGPIFPAEAMADGRRLADDQRLRFVERARDRDGLHVEGLTIERLRREIGGRQGNAAAPARLVNDLTLFARSPAAWERLEAYEALLDELLRQSDKACLCLYDRRQVPAEVLVRALRSHPRVAVPDHIHDNVFSIFSDSRLQPEARLDTMLATLARRIPDRRRGQRDSATLNDAMLDATHAMVAYMDTEFNFIKVNRAYAAADERAPDFFPGKNHFDLYPNDENELIFRRVVETGQAHRALAKPFEYAHSPDRGVSYWDWTLVPLMNAAKVEALVLTLTNVTDKVQALDAWRVAERERKLVLDATSEMLTFHDTDLRVRWANSAAARAAGVRTDDMAGKHCYELFHGRDGPCAECPVLRAQRSGESQEAEIETRDGRIWALRGYPVYGEDGEMIGLVEIGRDVTERKQRKREQERLAEQMQHIQMLESLGVLAGGIAHDFNNLLVAILGNASLALMDLPPDSPLSDTLEQIELAAKRASELSNQMLAYSGKGQFVLESIDLNELIREMRHLLEVSVSKNVALRFDLSPQIASIRADSSQMQQVILNLVTNASEAIEGSSGLVSVTTGVVRAERAYLSESFLDDNLPEGTYVFLQVSDTGIGMDEETRARIFDPFYSTKFTGRGLGLSAVLGIVRGHKGAINVYSEPGQGTTFKVLLPAKTAPSSEPTEAPSESVVPLPSKNETILVVDDNETVRAVSREMLERNGYTVITAGDGREALKVFRSMAARIDLVLLDLTMPHLDGNETFRELRRVRREVSVILMSGYIERDAIRKFAGKGLAGFIQKPFKTNALIAKVRSVLDGR